MSVLSDERIQWLAKNYLGSFQGNLVIDFAHAVADAAIAADRAARAEPAGYVQDNAFGWTECSPDDDGAIALYTAPPAAPVVPDGWKLVPVELIEKARRACGEPHPHEPGRKLILTAHLEALESALDEIAAPAGEQVGLTDAEVKEHFHHGSRTCKVSGPMNARDLAGIRQVIAAHEAKRNGGAS